MSAFHPKQTLAERLLSTQNGHWLCALPTADKRRTVSFRMGFNRRIRFRGEAR
jgi:hypothetical protein